MKTLGSIIQKSMWCSTCGADYGSPCRSILTGLPTGSVHHARVYSFGVRYMNPSGSLVAQVIPPEVLVNQPPLTGVSQITG